MLRNDVDGKQLRCLIVEDYQTGSVSKIRDRHQFEEILATTDEMFLTKIFEPTTKEREDLLKVLQVHHQDGEEAVDVPEEVVLFTMLKFTDLELDSTDFEDNQALLTEVLSNPNALFMAIKSELDLMFIESLAMLMDVQNAYRQMPDEWLDLSNKLQEVKSEIKTQERNIKTKSKKVNQLKKTLDDEIKSMGETALEVIQ